MNVQVVGCSHHETGIALREQLAFSTDQATEALDRWRRVFPKVEAVLLSTCNRVEVYAATEEAATPAREQVTSFLAQFHGLDPKVVNDQLYHHADEEAVLHLFTVASSLDSMVVGEPQILSQVKEAYELANKCDNTGPLTHAAFQTAIKVARRVTTETTIQQRRVSIPSVAVADFASQIFERFDDKQTLVIGAGEMAEETLRYLQDEGAKKITVVNRRFERAEKLAAQWNGSALPWEKLFDALTEADLVISTTGADEPIVTVEQFKQIEAARSERPLFVLDLAVPRDFDAAVGERPEVYLYSVDDLKAACARNQALRDQEMPVAMKIVQQEARRFMAALHHRATGPIIQQLKQGWQKPKEDELKRLFNKLPDLDDHSRDEVHQAFDRLINKLLHPPLESLRDESRHGIPHVLLDALAKLFQLRD